MSTQWNRKKKNINTNTNTNDQVQDNFFDPQYFDVLKNIDTTKETDSTTDFNGEPIREGFDIFVDSTSYFKGCKRYLKSIQAGSIGNGIKDIINAIFCPIYKADQIIQDNLESMLSIFLVLSCKDIPTSKNGDQNVNIDLSNVVDPNLLWVDTDSPLENFVSIEGFETSDIAGIKKTVDSFQTNHSWIDTDTLKGQIGTYYLQKLSLAETAKKSYFNQMELLEFNNSFDNDLNDPSVQYAIKNIVISGEWRSLLNLGPNTAALPTTTPPPTINTNPAPTQLKCDVPRNCTEKSQCALLELRKNTYKVKEEIYNIAMIPIMLYIFYNIYYMFFFQAHDGEGAYYENESGEKCDFASPGAKLKTASCKIPLFSDWDGLYQKYTGGNFDYIFEFIFKPVKYIYTLLNMTKSYNIGINASYPYIVFPVLFVVFHYFWQSLGVGGKLFKFLRTLLLFESLDKTDIVVTTISYFAGIVIGFSFVKSLIDKLPEWFNYGTKVGVFTAGVCWILWWIFKGLINMFIVPFAVLICVVYIILYFIFGIFINTTEVFKVIGHINQFIYTKLYVPFEDYSLETIRLLFWSFFVFLVELYSIYILVSGIVVYSKQRMSADMRTFLIILHASIIFIIVMWMALKMKTTLKEIAFFYDPFLTPPARPQGRDYRAVIPDNCFDVSKSTDAK